MRSADWVTRSERTRAKVLREVSQSAPLTEAQLALASGMTVREVREVTALVAARPVSMDAEPVELADGADTESSALVSVALRAAATAIAGLPQGQRELLVLKYYYGWTVNEAAEAVGGMEDPAGEHFQAVTVVRTALAAAVADV
jgi:DNA-directed RNA polymerase specialized sigma24 family protein